MSPVAPKEPLFFQRIAKPTVWGGQRLAQMLGFSAEGSDPIGETWELSDYPGMETSVRGGPFDGASLQQLLKDFPDDMLGESVFRCWSSSSTPTPI